MISHASARYVRMSARKVRYVLDIVRGKPVPVAIAILERTPKRACLIVKKLIHQAADSAHKQKEMKAESLVVSKIFADGAGMMKRFRSMSMGRAGMIRKRLSHITVELDAAKGVTVPAPDNKGKAPKAAPMMKPAKAAKAGALKHAPAKHAPKKLAGAK